MFIKVEGFSNMVVLNCCILLWLRILPVISCQEFPLQFFFSVDTCHTKNILYVYHLQILKKLSCPLDNISIKTTVNQNVIELLNFLISAPELFQPHIFHA